MKKLLVAASMFISTSCFASPTPSNVLVLTPTNHAVIKDEINSKTVSEFLKTFLSMEGNRRLVYISSPGGSVLDGMKAIQIVRDEKVANKNLRVVCYVDEAASMAFALVQSICDERHGGSTSTLMQHQATYGVQGSDNQIVSRLKMIASILRVLDSVQAKRIGITVEELRRRSADEWWTVGEEAVASHTLDSLSPAVCSKELLKETSEVKFSGFFGSGKAMYSKCPLITGPLEIIMDDHKPAHNLVKESFKRVPLSERVIRYK